MNTHTSEYVRGDSLVALLLENGEEFVEAAFWALLKRRPEASAWTNLPARAFDSSLDADPEVGNQPVPQLILRVEQGAVITDAKDLVSTPVWARPLVVAAFKQKR